MTKKLLFVFIFLLLVTSCYAADNVTTFYRMLIPENANRDWLSKISDDIVSIDSVLNMLSTDSAWIDSGTSIYTRTNSDSIAVGTMYPASSTKMTISADTAGLNMLRVISNDVGVGTVFGVDNTNKLIVSSDVGETSVGGVVGRIRVISSDGSECYIPLYSSS